MRTLGWLARVAGLWAVMVTSASADVHVTAVSSPPSGASVLLSQPLGRKGPTSIRYHHADSAARRVGTSPNPADPNEGKYWAKDRDLGQTFTTPRGERLALHAVTLRVGPSPSANDDIASLEGAAVSLQVFRVTGTPVIHNNGTTSGTVASAYPNLPEADDYIVGEVYTTLTIARGGVLPAVRSGGDNTLFAEANSSGTLLRFELRGADAVVLEPESVYAFMLMFDEPGEGRGLPLDNWDYLNQPFATPQQRRDGPYAGGHAIRREGRVEKPYETPEKMNAAFNGLTDDPSASTFPEFATRAAMQPGTWGRPDVDTWRDLVFWIESGPAPLEPPEPEPTDPSHPGPIDGGMDEPGAEPPMGLVDGGTPSPGSDAGAVPDAGTILPPNPSSPDPELAAGGCAVGSSGSPGSATLSIFFLLGVTGVFLRRRRISARR